MELTIEDAPDHVRIGLVAWELAELPDDEALAEWNNWKSGQQLESLFTDDDFDDASFLNELADARKRKTAKQQLSTWNENNPAPTAIDDEGRLADYIISQFSVGGVPTIRHYRDEWYWWDTRWQRCDPGQLEGVIYTECKSYLAANTQAINARSEKKKTVPKFGKSAVANVLLALRAKLSVKEIGWIDGRGGEWIAFADKLLDLEAWIAGEVATLPQTPAYFSPTSLDYALTYTDAEPTILLERLQDQFPNSPKSIAALQEFSGYCYTRNTDFQRILYMVGPPRSFKGTFERIIRRSIGEHNAVSKTMQSFVGPHALENVPGKLLLAISDSRPRPEASRQGVERFLSISGQDPQDINPKGRAPYSTTLDCKILIASNIIADFADPTGALLSRLLFVETTKSYAANPDPKLLEKILVQQNEICWWALRGLRRLYRNGKYTEPENNLRTRFEIQNNPVPCFINFVCEVTGNVRDKLTRDELYSAFETWCTDNRVAGIERNIFCREVYAAFPNVKGQERFIAGIKFKETDNDVSKSLSGR